MFKKQVPSHWRPMLIWVRSILDMPVVAGGVLLLWLCCILIAGLLPFGQPPNDVRWLGNRDGIQVGKYGTILSSGPLPLPNSESCSIEMWVRPDITDDSE